MKRSGNKKRLQQTQFYCAIQRERYALGGNEH